MATISAAAPAFGRATGIAVGLCFLAALAEGFDIQSMGVAAPTLAPALHLTRDQLGPAFSASTFGLLVGAIALGRLADRIGRKSTLLISLVIFGAFSLLTVTSWDFASLMAIRFCAGLGLGGAMPNLIALSAEGADGPARARVVTLMASGLPFGGALASAVAAGWDWKAIFEVGAAAPFLVAALVWPWLPESADFLAARSRASDAARVDLLGVFFGGGRALTTLCVWTSVFAALLTLFMLINWLPLLMGWKGLSKPAAATVAIVFNAGGGLGGLGLAALFHGRQRPWVLAVWYLGSAIGLVALAFAPGQLGAAALAGLVAGVFIASVATGIYGLAPDYYAVQMRGAGAGGMIGTGRIGAILGPLLAGLLLGRGRGVETAILALLPFVALSASAAFWLLTRPPAPDAVRA